MTDLSLKINKNEFINEMKIIMEYISNSNNKISDYDINSFLCFSSLAIELINNQADFERLSTMILNISDKQKAYIKRESKKFSKFILENKDVLNTIFNNAYNFFTDEIKFELCDKNIFREYNYEEFRDLILNFFNQYKYYNIVERYFDENRIQVGYSNGDYEAIFMNSGITKSGYIMLKENIYNTNLASTLSHELGHAINSNIFLFKRKNNNIFSDPYTEIPSACFETLFNEYIIDNQIDSLGGLILLNKIYSQIKNASTIKMIFPMFDENTMDNSGCVNLEYYNKNNQLILTNKVQFRKSILYGLGYIMSLYFYELNMKDKKEFINSYEDIISKRKKYSLEEIINKLGISLYDFSELKYVKDNIIENNNKLVRRIYG